MTDSTTGSAAERATAPGRQRGMDRFTSRHPDIAVTRLVVTHLAANC